MEDHPHAFFVYGTLKRGQSNYHLVADFVRGVFAATIRGRLYDVGPFPALVAGDDVIHGEVLTVDLADFPRLLPLLDNLEGYEQRDPVGSMYLRRVVIAATAGDLPLAAYAYFYNRDPAPLAYLPGGEWRGPSAAEVSPVSAEMEDFGRHVRDFPR